MIEYRAYHKTRPAKRGRDGRAVRKKERNRSGDPKMSRARLRLIGWIAAVLLAVVFTGVACASAFTWLKRSPLFTIRTVDMNRCANVSMEEVWVILRGRGAGNLWSVPVREVARRLSAHPWVRSVSVRKAFPDRLVVRIEEMKPVAMVNLDALHYLDEEGRPFKRLTAYDRKNLAIVTGFSRQELLRKDPVTLRDLRKTLDLLRGVEAGALRQNVSEIHFDAQDGYTVVTRDAGMQLKVGTVEVKEAIRRIEAAMPRISGMARSSGIADLKTEGRVYMRPGE
ncbi:MAG: Polypeptide-transport-associated domain protein FtsQ-type [Deltaproteobacteria bacterium]|nr:Polypeptide-transport-associated domain protein FtsQ-type [Deltaproteobacteria bacterium]